VGGLILLVLVEWALFATGNPNYIPSAIVLGAFLVPVTFVSYLYEWLPNWDVPLRPVVICFVWGGILGTVAADILEYDVARSLGFTWPAHSGLTLGRSYRKPGA
jgi:RsiW-degrading membrane proteinase PrsW (M82 family)